jgi:hypothetical protein
VKSTASATAHRSVDPRACNDPGGIVGTCPRIAPPTEPWALTPAGQPWTCEAGALPLRVRSQPRGPYGLVAAPWAGGPHLIVPLPRFYHRRCPVVRAAYQAGRRAGKWNRVGWTHLPAVNPHPRGSGLGWAWDRGYRAGERAAVRGARGTRLGREGPHAVIFGEDAPESRGSWRDDGPPIALAYLTPWRSKCKTICGTGRRPSLLPGRKPSGSASVRRACAGMLDFFCLARPRRSSPPSSRPPRTAPRGTSRWPTRSGARRTWPSRVR